MSGVFIGLFLAGVVVLTLYVFIWLVENGELIWALIKLFAWLFIGLLIVLWVVKFAWSIV